MPKTGWTPTFRMKQLPKAEYQIMKELIEQYGLDDPSELFTALLRLAKEVYAMRNADVDNGDAYLQRLITEAVTTVRQ